MGKKTKTAALANECTSGLLGAVYSWTNAQRPLWKQTLKGIKLLKFNLTFPEGKSNGNLLDLT